MHILVTNDDGPPSPHSSPYVHSLVRALQDYGHTVSVCLPHTQRSWIGKAHMIGQTVKPLYYRPPPLSSPAAGLVHEDERNDSHGTTHTRPSTIPGTEEWILVDGTPASCVQIGLYHFFQDRGPVDLVLSGPNYGRNSTAVFALSSGTLGGALEAAVCKRRAIALSYAFFTRNHDTEIIEKASRQSVRVVEALWKQWPEDGSVDLYSVNVPLLEGLEGGKVLFTGMLQNYWGEGSCFTEVDGSVDGEVEDEERIREGEKKKPGEEEKKPQGKGEVTKGGGLHSHKHFKWSPRFTDVYKSVDEAGPGNDGWAVKEGHTSITPLKANFFQAATHLHGEELQLGPSKNSTFGITPAAEESKTTARDATTANGDATTTLPILSKDPQPANKVYALINYGDTYVQPLITSAISSLLPPSTLTLLPTPPTWDATANPDISLPSLLPSDFFPKKDKILQIMPYESLDFDYAMSHPSGCLINSYMIRKALIRKHYLAKTVENYLVKNPDSVLARHVKRSEAFEVDFAEFLDEALVEAWDLNASLERNGGVEEEEEEEGGREWWILKPGMSDRGQGIRLFSTMEELQEIFDGWEPESDDEDEEDDDNEGGGKGGDGDDDEEKKEDEGEEESDGIMTSHLRHFIAQPYIHPPLLLPSLQNRKFHLRVYALTVGAMKVYCYRDILALFSSKPYKFPPTTDPEELDAHLTNTCLQSSPEYNDSVHRFWDLPSSDLSGQQKENIWVQVQQVTGEVFEAAAREMMIHFQPLEQGFEVWGVDFLVDEKENVWLLEVNSFPDFKQTGRLTSVVEGFWKGVVGRAVVPFVLGEQNGEGGKGGTQKGEGDMVLVREVELGRRF
ncbi:survival protein sure-like phosphatase/nucleotidase [Apiosordaria backusii]|uniref:Survival protein sure-like phosphatase/nucleotidase n=1 Tax=Apiosordaria backusii TaxID=314023 RepID=A0AA40ENA4_9PEZI|nr:survival protein sure-like phosphatase/nucleotidase [Apiosordaria backusii]